VSALGLLGKLLDALMCANKNPSLASLFSLVLLWDPGRSGLDRGRESSDLQWGQDLRGNLPVCYNFVEEHVHVWKSSPVFRQCCQLEYHVCTRIRAGVLGLCGISPFGSC
jgi:hypothetical protein